MIVCTYEDRPSALVGLKLLILSLAHHCPQLQIHLYTPLREKNFSEWLEKQSNVVMKKLPDIRNTGWDIKPGLLLDLLNEGFENVIWLDSDIIVNRNFRPTMEAFQGDVLIAVEEHLWVTGHNSPQRTLYLGLELGRIFPITINTCILRVTPYHRDLIGAWNSYLLRDDYKKSQSQSFDDRPWYLGSDQDILAGLLGSTDFADIPVKQLKSGANVAHCFCGYGYSVIDRIKNLFRGLPDFVHAQGPKPWEIPEALFSELSPYCYAAAHYKDYLDEPAKWMEVKSGMARFFNFIALSNPNLRDFPLAVVYETRERWRSFTRRADSQ